MPRTSDDGLAPLITAHSNTQTRERVGRLTIPDMSFSKPVCEKSHTGR